MSAEMNIMTEDDGCEQLFGLSCGAEESEEFGWLDGDRLRAGPFCVGFVT